jgi:DNA adenine methylase
MQRIEVPTFLKWAGGKQQLLTQFAEKKIFPDKVEHYVEPFLGGGAVLFYVLKYKQPQTVKAFDKNIELINVYNEVKNNADSLIEELIILEKEHNKAKDAKDYYRQNKELFNHIKKSRKIIHRNKTKKAALFIYLNKTCFNGLYRENSLGEFNVPFNGKSPVKIFNKQDIIDAHNLLNSCDVDIKQKDFKRLPAYKNKVLYFDPPYWSEPHINGFTKYNADDFGEKSQRDLAKKIILLANNDCHTIISNSDTGLIRELYPNKIFKIHDDISVRRMINCDGKGRAKISELLITSKY